MACSIGDADQTIGVLPAKEGNYRELDEQRSKRDQFCLDPSSYPELLGAGREKNQAANIKALLHMD